MLAGLHFQQASLTKVANEFQINFKDRLTISEMLLYYIYIGIKSTNIAQAYNAMFHCIGERGLHMPEFGDIIICEEGFKNITENGELTAFQIRVRISYYRGVPLCLIVGYDIDVDEEHFGPQDVTFSLDGSKFYSLEEMADMRDIWWNYGDKAYLHVKKPGGLKRGLHTVKVTQRINVPYLPFNTAFNQIKQLTIV